MTVKHHYSISSTYIDCIYTSTPLVSGFESIYCPQVTQFNPTFYSHDSLVGSTEMLSDADKSILNTLKRIQANGVKLISSVSRVEKTVGEQYLREIELILHNSPKTTLICFGKSFPPEYKKLMAKAKNRMIYLVG